MHDSIGDHQAFTPDGTTGACSDNFSIFSPLPDPAADDDVPGALFFRASKAKKDPIKMARKYQLELCKKAMEENVIVYLGTGCGKTHIAVLLIHEMGHLTQKPHKSICVFVAPTVDLVQQQAKVIEESLDFKVSILCGKSKHLAKEREQYEVLVMTPQILLCNLSHCFINMESISLLIFDECHHAQIGSNHPYAEIMKVFYKSDDAKCPRIFGMTASPLIAKGASNYADLPRSINSLELLLNAKVYSVDNKSELERFVTTPVIKVYKYGPGANDFSRSYLSYYSKLEEIKHQCLSTLSWNSGDPKSIKYTKRLLTKIHNDINYCMVNLGLCALLQSTLVLGCECSEFNEIRNGEGIATGDFVYERYLLQAAEVLHTGFTRDGFLSSLSCVDDLKEPIFSRKLVCLIEILSSFRLQPNMKCIVFVKRVVTAKSLSYILQRIKFLAWWKCDFLVGVNSGQRNRKTMNTILEKFRSGELNLLFATKVGEEGLDIQTCCLVVRFDLPETVSSFIQSRGRARMPHSEYVFLINSCKPEESDLIESFRRAEDQMNTEITLRTSKEVFDCYEECVYKVDSSGACTSSVYSISLFHRYCSKLPHDEFYDPKPRFSYFDDSGGIVCHIILPSNAPIYEIVSSPKSSMEAAKKDACLKAIRELHMLGALGDTLLPSQKDKNQQRTDLEISDSESCEDDDSRGELHAMLLPAALKEPWSNVDNINRLYSYYIVFNPMPEDRNYKKFGLFVKTPLPEEAEKMELDLHLAHNRSVMTKFVYLGVDEFNNEEILLAENFQEMFLKIILDRSEFVSDYVLLGNNDFRKSSAGTFYLLLPLALHDYEDVLVVDWQIIRRCLSSPIFRTPTEPVHKENTPSDDLLYLANGHMSASDIENSVVYASHKNVFVFVTSIVKGSNGYSPFKDSSASNHMNHLTDRFGIHLKYAEQPLLRGKTLFNLHNLLRDRKSGNSESVELEEHFIDMPPELCQLKIFGFSKDIGSSISLLPSIMHRLENILVAVELKQLLSSSFPEGADVTANRILEALTTEKCQERFSLERLEILGDAFLKFSVGRRLFLLHGSLDEGELTRRRSNAVSNSNLLKLATRRGLQVYIRDQPFDPCQFFAFGRPCPIICDTESQVTIHGHYSCGTQDHADSKVRCSKGHHWLHKKTIADMVEALVGAFIVDCGFKATCAFLQWIGIEVEFDAAEVIDVWLASSNYIPLTTCMDIAALETSLGYQFIHKGLLLQAFLHPSYGKQGGCYQRLEFLGDAVLDYLITAYLYSVYPKLKPGQLTDLRSACVSNKAFAKVAIDQSFDKFLISDSSGLSEAIKDYASFIKKPESERSFIEGPKCPKALGDLVESCLGAVLIDTGFDLERVWNIMLSFLEPVLSFSGLELSPIRELQELCQSHDCNLKFLSSKMGSSFVGEAIITGADISVTASATNINKKDAIRNAAQRACTMMKAEGYLPKFNLVDKVLCSSPKMTAKIIGYDETPINVIEFKEYNAQASVTRQASSHEHIYKNSRETIQNTYYGSNPHTTGAWTARSCLYKMCAASLWKPPKFECCKEEGPSHLKLFTFMVILEIEEAPGIVLECFGEPRSKKKLAAEHAAEGALWFLKNEFSHLVSGG